MWPGANWTLASPSQFASDSRRRRRLEPSKLSAATFVRRGRGSAVARSKRKWRGYWINFKAGIFQNSALNFSFNNSQQNSFMKLTIQFMARKTWAVLNAYIWSFQSGCFRVDFPHLWQLENSWGGWCLSWSETYIPDPWNLCHPPCNTRIILELKDYHYCIALKCPPITTRNIT